jgi:hypothetical protein
MNGGAGDVSLGFQIQPATDKKTVARLNVQTLNVQYKCIVKRFNFSALINFWASVFNVPTVLFLLTFNFLTSQRLTVLFEV